MTQRAGNDFAVICFETCIGIPVFIPCNDGRIAFSIPPSVQIDTDRIIREDLASRHLRRNIVSILDVLQIVVIVRCPVRIVIFSELPERGIDLAAGPFDVVARIIAADQRAVVIYCVEFITLCRIVPDPGVNDDLLTVLDFFLIRNADFFCGIKSKIIIIQNGPLHKIQIDGIG